MAQGIRPQVYGMMATAKLAEQRGEQNLPLRFVPWAEPVSEEERHACGDAVYPPCTVRTLPLRRTAFRRGASLDYLYGEIWTREEHLSRRDRRIISICCSAAVGVEGETKAHVEAALTNGELTLEELQELVVHFAVYVGWVLGRQLDDLLLEVGQQS